jgi:hypothetical protein
MQCRSIVLSRQSSTFHYSTFFILYCAVVPRLRAVDADGDGMLDLVLNLDGELLVYRQDAHGRFALIGPNDQAQLRPVAELWP